MIAPACNYSHFLSLNHKKPQCLNYNNYTTFTSVFSGNYLRHSHYFLHFLLKGWWRRKPCASYFCIFISRLCLYPHNNPQIIGDRHKQFKDLMLLRWDIKKRYMNHQGCFPLPFISWLTTMGKVRWNTCIQSKYSCLAPHQHKQEYIAVCFCKVTLEHLP